MQNYEGLRGWTINCATGLMTPQLSSWFCPLSGWWDGTMRPMCPLWRVALTWWCALTGRLTLLLNCHFFRDPPSSKTWHLYIIVVGHLQNRFVQAFSLYCYTILSKRRDICPNRTLLQLLQNKYHISHFTSISSHNMSTPSIKVCTLCPGDVALIFLLP